MPRHLRISLQGVTYFVTSRCHNLKNMIQRNTTKDELINVLNMTKEKYLCEIIAYTITDNQIYFIIKTVEGGATISRIMQFIKSQLAQRYNRKMNRTGAFWNERFKDVIIESCSDPGSYFHSLQWDMGYVAVREKKVSDPRDYQYSSIRVYLDDSYVSPVKITLHEYFLKLGNTFHERALKFLEFEDMYRKDLVHLL